MEGAWEKEREMKDERRRVKSSNLRKTQAVHGPELINDTTTNSIRWRFNYAYCLQEDKVARQ